MNCPYHINIPENERFQTITYPGVAIGRYSISNKGKIVRFDGYEISQFMTKDNYLACNLMMTNGSQGFFYIHRLVAWDWVYYNRNLECDVIHINEINTDNRYTNLEWRTLKSPSSSKVSTRCPYTIIIPLKEEFRIVSYPGIMPGRYSVSNNGKIIRYDGYEVSQFMHINGYLSCNLMKSDRSQILVSVHRIVAWEWVLKNRNFNLTVNHIDGFKTNNQYTNLEWVTIEENLRHANETGLIQNHFGEGTNHKLTEEDVHKVCQIMENPKATYEEVLRVIGNKVDVGTLRAIVNGRAWQHITSQYNIQSRTQKGENHNANKLTEADVHYICRLLQDPCMKYEDVAAKLNNKVSVHAVIDIAHGRTWQHITKDYNIPFRQLKGLHAGVNHPQNKLTEKEVHFICSKLQEGKYTYKQIAQMIGDKVTTHTIFRIASGKIWKNISVNYNFPKR